MAWAVLLCLCSWWRWCRGSRLWSLFLFSFLSLLLLSISKISPPSSCLPLSVCLPFSLFLQNFCPPVSASFLLFRPPSPSPKFSPRFVPLLLKKIVPLVSVLSPVFIGSRGRGTIPCPSAGHGGVGWLLCSRCKAWSSFRHGGGYGLCPGFVGKWEEREGEGER